MSIGSIIDGEPTVATQALALKRALVELVSDAPQGKLDQATLDLLNVQVDLNHMYKFGGGTTAHNTTRTTSPVRVGNFVAAQHETHLAAIDTQLKRLGGS